jgi:hypothetical protein
MAIAGSDRNTNNKEPLLLNEILLWQAVGQIIKGIDYQI